MNYKDKYEKYKKKYLLQRSNSGSFVPINFIDLPTNFPYRENAKPNNIHIGQRKLLLNEVYFLSRFGNLSNTVVYAGAAPGTHISLLAELFPNHKFILYDPSRFNIKETDNIKIFTGEDEGYFTGPIAKQYANQNVLFISDIRSVKGITDFKEFESRVIIDNELQKEWVTIMKPAKASLKFRIPFTIKEPYEYFDGLIEVQAWAPKTSSETRLITDGLKMKKYDPIAYENKMFYFNNYIRPNKTYGNLSWDTAYEIFIWQQYFKKTNIDNQFIRDKIKDIMNKVTQVLNRDIRGKYL